MALCALAGQDDPVAAMRRAVDRLLTEAEVTGPPADLALLGSLRGVREIRPLNLAEAGRLVPEGHGYLIHVNRSHPEGKRRFTIGHEICHTFFNAAEGQARPSVDGSTGLFDIRQEEEYLCDIGAAHMLLNPGWLVPMAQSGPASLDRLFEIADGCGASIEAAAFQVAQSGAWPCTFVFWEPGFRKSERIPAEQRAFGGWEGVAGPAEKLRASRVYGTDGAPYLPRNKSVGFDSGIYRALAEETRTDGEECFDIGRRPARARCQSEYAPYYDETGTRRPRVVSIILWKETVHAALASVQKGWQ